MTDGGEPFVAGFVIVGGDAVEVIGGEHVDAEIIEQEPVGTVPLVRVIAAVDVGETILDVSHLRQFSLPDAVGNGLYFRCRSEQSRQVGPFAGADGAFGQFPHPVFRHLAHVEPHSEFVVENTLGERRSLDEAVAVVVDRLVFTLFGLQPSEQLQSPGHFGSYHRVEPVEVDDAPECPLKRAQRITVVLRAFVALGPFAHVAVGAHGEQVASGHDIGGVALADEIGEGQQPGVGVLLNLADANRETTHVGGQEQMSSAGRLAAAFHHPVVYGAKFVGMVAEVGGRPGVVE